MVRCEARRAEEVPLGCGGDLRERAGALITRRTRRGVRGEVAWMPVWAGPKARKGAQRQGDPHAPEEGAGMMLYINGVLRGRSP